MLEILKNELITAAMLLKVLVGIFQNLMAMMFVALLMTVYKQ